VATASTTPITTFPWQPDSTATGDLAIKGLREGLMTALKNQRGIHTETLLTAVGALAGFAAQNAALDRLSSRDPAAPKLELAIAQTKSGRLIFGDAVNVFLYPEAHSTLPLVAIIAGAAVQAGIPTAELPDFHEMAAYVATVVGTPDFGILRARPGNPPQLGPLELLRKLWPMTREVLQRPPHKGILRRPEKPLQETHWPIIISVVGSQLIGMTKGVLSPRIGAALLIESAVITSKIDPETIEPGKWRISAGAATGEAPEPITRLRK
jgi:hypothetical protein